MGLRQKISLVALLCACVASVAHAKRLALVIGNDSYQNVQPLKNARSDAKAPHFVTVRTASAP